MIRGEDGGGVIIRGSNVVSGWRPLGDGLYEKSDWRVNSQQVYVDGRPLARSGGDIRRLSGRSVQRAAQTAQTQGYLAGPVGG